MPIKLLSLSILSLLFLTFCTNNSNPSSVDQSKSTQAPPPLAGIVTIAMDGISMTPSSEKVLDLNDCSKSYHASYGFLNSQACEAYYNSIFELFVEWGIDFVKYDFMTTSPNDIEAVSKALNNCGRPMLAIKMLFAVP